MRLLKYEFLKIITNKLFIITFITLWILNIFFLHYQNYKESKNDIPYKAYKTLEIDLKGKTHEEKGKYINETYERVQSINTIYDIQNNLKSTDPNIKKYAINLQEKNKDLYKKYYEESKKPNWKYTGNIDKELTFLKKIKKDYETINNYQTSIEEIIEESENLKNISIFKNKDEISLKNITKTATIYKTMLNTKVNYEIGTSVEKISSVNITDFLILILIFILSTIIITEEKEKNLLTIIKITKNGKSKTIITKIISLLISSLLIYILFYGINIIYYFKTLGYGDLTTSIQSISYLSLSTLKVNIYEYLIILFASKYTFIFLVATITFYLSIDGNNNENILKLCILIIINILIYKNIEITSNINILKSFNLINLLNTEDLFKTYTNLRLYNIIVPKTSTLLTLELVTIVYFIIGSIIKYLKNTQTIVKENKILLKIKKFKITKNLKFNNIFSFEIYKLLIINKSLIIIILFITFTIINYKNQNYSLSSNEMYYKNYMEILNGPLTKEKERLIENTLKEYEKAKEEINKINEKREKGEISHLNAMILSQPYEEILSTEKVFTKVENKYKYLKNNPKASFVYDTGYNKLFRINKTINEYDIYLIIITIIVILNCFIMEYKTGFINILNTTKNSRTRTATAKVLVTITICTFIYIISIIPEIMETHKMYGTYGILSSITSLETFKNLPKGISILLYLIYHYLTRYISYILIILIIENISLKLKNTIFTFITSLFILILPYILNKLNLYKTNIFPLLNPSIIGENIINTIIIPIIVILDIFLYNKITKRLEWYTWVKY